MFFEFLTKDFLNGVASATAIVLFVVAIVSWYKSRISGIYYFTKRFDLVKPVNVESIDISVSSGEKTSAILYRDIVFIVNKTGRAIDDADFVGTPFSFCREVGNVFLVRQIDIPGSGKFQFSCEEHEVQIKTIKMRNLDSIAFEVFHDGCLLHTISSSPRVEPFVRYDLESVELGLDFLAWSIVFLCVVFSVPYFYFPMIPVSSIESVPLAIFSALFVVVSYGAAILYFVFRLIERYEGKRYNSSGERAMRLLLKAV